MSEDIRWEQRFENLERAVRLLEEGVMRGAKNLSDLEKEGVVQRFEYSLELAWKTLRDYLEHEGHEIVPLTPRNVLKEAFGARVLRDVVLWIEMLERRNLLSHTYDARDFSDAVDAIEDRYMDAFLNLRDWLRERKSGA